MSEKTLYSELVDAGVEVSNWQSDLYFPVTEQTREILARYPTSKQNARQFKSNIDGKMMYDVPFGFLPYWEKRNPT